MSELDDYSPCSIAQLKNLKNLSVRLDHPHTRYPGITRKFCESSPLLTVWSNLGSKLGNATLGRLRSLNLERAGIMDYQLAKVLESNPMQTELRLRKRLSLTDITLKILAENNVGQHVETLFFTMSDSDESDDRILEYIWEATKPKGTTSLVSPPLELSGLTRPPTVKTLTVIL